MSLATATESIKAKAVTEDTFGSTIKFNFEEGCILLDGTGDVNKVSNEDIESACTVNVSLENFEKLLAGDLNPMMAFMSGKIKVDGDMSLAMKLPQFLG